MGQAALTACDLTVDLIFADAIEEAGDALSVAVAAAIRDAVAAQVAK